METQVTMPVNAKPVVLANKVTVTFVDDFRAPVPIGTVLGHVAVEPAGWIGAVSLEGNDVEFVGMMLSGFVLVAVAEIHDPREYHFTVKATP